MISRATTILAIILPLGLCLFAALSVVVILSIRFTRVKGQLKEQLNEQQERIREQKERLDKWFNRSGSHMVDAGSSGDELKISYENNYWFISNPVRDYIDKWMSVDISQPSTSDEISRLEASLLSGPPSAWKSESPDRDYSIFPNPQKYTSAEIVARLCTKARREVIQQIIVSILLKNTSINGDPCATLLPLDPADIAGLYNVHEAVRNGLRLYNTLSGHICRFGFFKAKSGNQISSQRERYHTLFENVFQPYFKSNSREDVLNRREDLNKVFDGAVAHGMLCLAFIGDVEYRWSEERLDPLVEIAPAMVVGYFPPGERVWREHVILKSNGWDL